MTADENGYLNCVGARIKWHNKPRPISIFSSLIFLLRKKTQEGKKGSFIVNSCVRKVVAMSNTRLERGRDNTDVCICIFLREDSNSYVWYIVTYVFVHTDGFSWMKGVKRNSGLFSSMKYVESEGWINLLIFRPREELCESEEGRSLVVLE